jgi:hypothetical protein
MKSRNFFIISIKKINLENAVLIHGGGWKKLESKKISNRIFKKKLLTNYNIRKVINYYGLIEQVGSIFFECPTCNVFICSDFSDIFPLIFLILIDFTKKQSQHHI